MLYTQLLCISVILLTSVFILTRKRSPRSIAPELANYKSETATFRVLIGNSYQDALEILIESSSRVLAGADNGKLLRKQLARWLSVPGKVVICFDKRNVCLLPSFLEALIRDLAADELSFRRKFQLLWWHPIAERYELCGRDLDEALDRVFHTRNSGYKKIGVASHAKIIDEGLQGKEFRQKFLGHLDHENVWREDFLIDLDMSGVLQVSFSFFREAVGYFCRYADYTEVLNRVRLVNASDVKKEIYALAVQNTIKPCCHSEPGDYQI